MWERGRGRDGCVGVAEMCTTSARVSAVMQLSDNFSFFVRLSAVTRRYGDFPVVLSTREQGAVVVQQWSVVVTCGMLW